MFSRTRRRERGDELVEAALVMPLLLIMLAIVVDLGRAYFCYIAVIDAAREGARYGATYQNSTEMCATALAEAQNQPLPVALTCVANTGNGSGTPVSVTVSCNFPVIMGRLVGRSSILISQTVAFRIR
jgi:Flp pilus assembly protein TadG